MVYKFRKKFNPLWFRGYFSKLAELYYIVVKINHKNNDFYALSHKMPDFLYGSMTALKMNKGNIIMVNLTSVFTLMKILGIESTLPSSHNMDDWNYSLVTPLLMPPKQNNKRS